MRNKIFIGAMAVSLIMFAYIAVSVLNGNMQAFNDAAYNRIAPMINPASTRIMMLMSNIGEWFIYLPISLLFLIIPRARVKIGIPVALTISVSAILNILLKNIFAVARPDINRLIGIGGYGFPSGHAMNGTVFIGLCTYMFIKYSYKRPLKIAASLFSFLFMLLMGFSRMYLGVHTASDVLGGYWAGLAVLSAAMVVVGFPEKTYKSY